MKKSALNKQLFQFRTDLEELLRRYHVTIQLWDDSDASVEYCSWTEKTKVIMGDLGGDIIFPVSSKHYEDIENELLTMAEKLMEGTGNEDG